MADRVTVKLTGPSARFRAAKLVQEAPDGFVVTVAEETRSVEQNRLMWPLIRDMREQNEHMATFSPEQVKLRFLDALGEEMTFLPKLWGGGMFPVGQRSSTLTKTQFSMLLELMFKWGAENGIVWSEKSRQSLAEAA